MSHMSQQAFPDQSPGYRNAPPAAFADPAAPANPDVYDGLPLEDYPIPISQEALVIRASDTPHYILNMILSGSFGLLLLAEGVLVFVDGKFAGGLIVCLLGLAHLAFGAVLLSMRTTLDAGGIHTSSLLGTRDHPWPASRTGFFVRRYRGIVMVIISGASATLVTPEGGAVGIHGLSWMGLSLRRLEAKGMAELDRIWAWAVARGYTREAGRYTELRGPRKRLQLQLQRREQERRHGLI